MGKVTFECPSCSARLNAPDGSKLGKKIKCPKCQEIFTPEPIEDDDDAFEDDEPKQPSTRKKGGGGTKGSKKGGKGKAAEGGSSLPLIIGGIVAVLVLAGVGLYFSGVFASKPAPAAAQAPAVQPVAAPAPVAAHSAPAPAPVAPQLTPAEKVLGLKWMPADTEFIIHVKVAELLQSPLLKPLLDSPQFSMSMQQSGGISPTDVDSVTFAVKGVTEAITTSIAVGGGMPMGMPMNPAKQTFVAILKTKKPIELKQLQQGTPNTTIKEKNGKSYMEAAATPFSPANGAWAPDSTTFILGTMNELFATMEKGETVTPRKEFASIDHTPHIVLALMIPELKTESPGDANPAIDSPEFQKPGAIQLAMVRDFIQTYSLKMASIGLSIKGGFDLQVAVLTGTDDGKQKLKSLAETGQMSAKGSLENYKKTGLPLIGEIGDILLANLKIEEQGQTVKVSTSMPDSERSKLEQLGPTLTLMAMTGQLNAFGGPPGGPGGAGNPFDPSFNPGFMKAPGETAAVDSSSVEGLPDGLKLSAKTAWGITASMSADGSGVTTSSALEIIIDVNGDGLDKICAAAEVAPKTMTIEGGSLKKPKKSGAFDQQKGFAFFDPNEQTFEHPPQTLRVHVTVEPPAGNATKIGVLEGSFKILTSADSRQISIDEVPKKVKRVLTDSDLKALEIKLRRGPSGVTPESVGVVCGKEHFLGRVKGTPGDIISVTEFDKDQTVQRLYATNESGKFPDDFKIEFTVYPNVKEQTVTFRFENVPLPAPDSKPAPAPDSKPQF